MPIEEAALAAARANAGGTDRQLLTDGPPLSGAVVPAPQAGGTLAVTFSARIDQLLQPFTLNIDEWAEALFKAAEFPETDPDDATNAMLAAILMAETSEEVLASMELNRAKEMCGDEPGGHSPLLTIYGARPVKSEYEDGANCYIIVDARYKVDGKSARFTTGARAVQAAILAHVVRGWLPFDAMLEIRRERTRKGYYPLNLVAGG
jgi:hypothetical protein